MSRGTAPFRVDLRVLVIACLALLLVAATSYRAFRPPRAWVNLTPLSFESPAQRSAPSTALQSEGPESETAGDLQLTKSPGERSAGTPGGQADGAIQVRPAEVGGAESLIAGEQEWLLACQLPDGAIAQTPDGETVVPYFASIAARTIVDIEPARARAYMSWYIQHMNLPDRSGLSGTIYDYEMRQGVLTPTFSYDSADSYAATFLSLASYYLSRTGDRGFISANLDAIDLAASVILTLQDKDGLVMVMPGSRTKYLMDNCESYRGLLDWSEAIEALGYVDRASLYRSAAERMREGIEGVLYDPARQAYAWSYSWFGKRFPRADTWYPDNVSQIDLISSGVLSQDDPKAVKIWQDFNAQFPSWDQGEGAEKDGFPWARVALVAIMMNDTREAENLLDWLSREFTRNGHPYPWHVMESANTIEVNKALLKGRPG